MPSCLLAALPLQPLLHYVSGLASTLRLHCLPDETNHFIVRKLLEGCRHRNARQDQRLPITNDILRCIIPALNSVCLNQFESNLFRVAFLLAFYGFLRIGEITVNPEAVVLVYGIELRIRTLKLTTFTVWVAVCYGYESW